MQCRIFFLLIFFYLLFVPTGIECNWLIDLEYYFIDYSTNQILLPVLLSIQLIKYYYPFY